MKIGRQTVKACMFFLFFCVLPIDIQNISHKFCDVAKCDNFAQPKVLCKVLVLKTK